jgi:hypothetical protein
MPTTRRQIQQISQDLKNKKNVVSKVQGQKAITKKPRTDTALMVHLEPNYPQIADGVGDMCNKSFDCVLAEIEAKKVEPQLVIEKEKFYNTRPEIYAWAVIGLLFLIRTAFIWHHKSFMYIYGFVGDGVKHLNPMYEIIHAYPNIDKYYGVLSGLAYSLPNSIVGLFLGLLPKGYNRKVVMSAVTIIAGVSMSLTGMFDSLIMLSAMRMVNGACDSVAAPLFY